jgi:hypothetical protein
MPGTGSSISSIFFDGWEVAARWLNQLPYLACCYPATWNTKRSNYRAFTATIALGINQHRRLPWKSGERRPEAKITVFLATLSLGRGIF